MKTKELDTAVQELMELFPKSFINSINELILVPKTNLYFRLEDVETLLDLKCKIIAWCSRACCKTAPFHSTWRNEQYQKEVRNAVNNYFGTDFNVEEWMYIYTYLGNDIRRELCEKFVESDFDIEVIKKECGND